jgi:hypothetical protein
MVGIWYAAARGPREARPRVRPAIMGSRAGFRYLPSLNEDRDGITLLSMVREGCPPSPPAATAR